MGRVTFNGNIATTESQVFIREQELKIIQGSGDEFTKARKIERLYQQNGLIPGTFFRAGSANFGERGPAAPKYDSKNPVVHWLKTLVGFVLILIAIQLMQRWGY